MAAVKKEKGFFPSGAVTDSLIDSDEKRFFTPSHDSIKISFFLFGESQVRWPSNIIFTVGKKPAE